MANVTTGTTERQTGSCHCGAVKFEVTRDVSAPGSRCNCTVCTKTAVTSAIVKPEAFLLLAGVDSLSEYVQGAGISQRYFCKRCGVHCFGRGHLAQVGGDYVAINMNCLDGVELSTLAVVYWDGRHDNWQGGPRSSHWPILEAPDAARRAAGAEATA